MLRARYLLLLLPTLATAQVYPGKTWQTDNHALSPVVKRRIYDYVNAMDTTGLVIVKGGKIAFQYGDTKTLSYLASSRKSVLSMLYGKYVENGTIDLSKTLADLKMDDNPAPGPDRKTIMNGLLPIEKTATVRDLIMARSGVYHPASNPGDSLADAPQRGSQKPGTYWLYSNWDFNAAGHAFEEMTHHKIFDALQNDLAIPIQMQDFDRNRQQMLGDLKASRYPAYHMWFSTRDMARLGLLMLDNGKWRGKQLVPAKWVKESTSVLTPNKDLHPASARMFPFGYGYLWWVWDAPFNTGAFKGAYTSRGAYGQYIAVLPALNIVAAHKNLPVNRFFADTDWVQLLHRVAGDTPASEIVLPVLEKQGRAAAIAKYHAIEKKPGIITDESDLFSAGVAADHEKHYRLAEEAFDLNLAIYPFSARSILGLGRTYRDEGNRAMAIKTFKSVPNRGFNQYRAKIELAELGEPVDGHNLLLAYPLTKMDHVAGRYKSKDLRYIVKRDGNRLHIVEIDPFGDINDDYLALADSKGGYYVPFDGTHIDFSFDAKGAPTEIVRTVGKEKQRGSRQ